jgi:hypothetical protein
LLLLLSWALASHDELEATGESPNATTVCAAASDSTKPISTNQTFSERMASNEIYSLDLHYFATKRNTKVSIYIMR